MRVGATHRIISKGAAVARVERKFICSTVPQDTYFGADVAGAGTSSARPLFTVAIFALAENAIFHDDDADYSFVNA